MRIRSDTVKKLLCAILLCVSAAAAAAYGDWYIVVREYPTSPAIVIGPFASSHECQQELAFSVRFQYPMATTLACVKDR